MDGLGIAALAVALDHSVPDAIANLQREVEELRRENQHLADYLFEWQEFSRHQDEVLEFVGNNVGLALLALQEAEPRVPLACGLLEEFLAPTTEELVELQ
jgi:FtsZ-binding cell division protein ZapB